MVKLIFHGQFTEIETDTLQKLPTNLSTHTHWGVITAADFHCRRTFCASRLHTILNSIKSSAH